ncbi:hypothetical protein SCHPADRAFT_904916 [Schizopora paradoxa]|uniref:Uncharacterized protein n=1 Tax=Schizopora paradoxa TaxID=27342 RepID=A0A0H2RLC3_9AGAM|nr:hypothetical protein SCHPADRAFT_904916 [Schizopora paradoxa]
MRRVTSTVDDSLQRARKELESKERDLSNQRQEMQEAKYLGSVLKSRTSELQLDMEDLVEMWNSIEEEIHAIMQQLNLIVANAAPPEVVTSWRTVSYITLTLRIRYSTRGFHSYLGNVPR